MFKVIDLAVSLDFNLPGNSTLTVRAEATNAFNIVNYGQPGNSVPSGATSTTFGIIRTANAMRRMQLGARLTFCDVDIGTLGGPLDRRGDRG